MEGDFGGDIDIRHAVAVGEAESVFIFHMVGHALEATTCERVLTGVHQRDPPRFGILLMDLHLVMLHVEGDVRHMEEIVSEVFLDDIAPVAAADHEVIRAMGGAQLHDVPENWLAADLNHRLGFEVGFLGDAGAETTGEYDCFHAFIASIASVASERRLRRLRLPEW